MAANLSRRFNLSANLLWVDQHEPKWTNMDPSVDQHGPKWTNLAIQTFFSEIEDMFAFCFLGYAIGPVAGSYDNKGIAITALMIAIYPIMISRYCDYTIAAVVHDCGCCVVKIVTTGRCEEGGWCDVITIKCGFYPGPHSAEDVCEQEQGDCTRSGYLYYVMLDEIYYRDYRGMHEGFSRVSASSLMVNLQYFQLYIRIKTCIVIIIFVILCYVLSIAFIVAGSVVTFQDAD